MSYFGTRDGGRYPKKVAGTQSAKNAEKANIVKALRVHFPLQLLLTRIGLARSVFFYYLKPKGDSNAELAQQIEAVYHHIKETMAIAVLRLR